MTYHANLTVSNFCGRGCFTSFCAWWTDALSDEPVAYVAGGCMIYFIKFLKANLHVDVKEIFHNAYDADIRMEKFSSEAAGGGDIERNQA